MDRRLSRRAVLAGGSLLLVGAAESLPANRKLRVSIFSKHLQFLQGEELAKAVVAIGFDGVDLTVRRGGHVAPERVRQDLPTLVSAMRRSGLDVPMITADIVDAGSPHAEDVLQTMAELGIRYYRWGGFEYKRNRPYAAQLDEMKPRAAKLAALNSRYHVCAMYHTHSGAGLVGASIWDLYILLKELDPQAIGVNYDAGHAVVEGGLGGWIHSFEIIRPYLRGIAVKDFVWARNARGHWTPQWTPLGEGMVHLSQLFAMVAESGFDGPLQLHFEYPLGGADEGRANIAIHREEVFKAMRRDLATVRAHIAAVNL